MGANDRQEWNMIGASEQCVVLAWFPDDTFAEGTDFRCLLGFGSGAGEISGYGQ
jgi:hypothetical protein